ncbi:flagellar biosynthesis protein FlhB [Clostridium cylindrosporum]|uniref:Flagellar biosynthetic protein FliR n=1 Tax=Clostridium cylindrosporum DSM 605 TaxID=1121307 RepID=A0A0J8DBP5_CLOCY|nr:flagellar biosynthesis protein FlhB [Clostridium cylindrosporum]KMT21713.1 flagellar biosynthetic protein FlhB [Clostridium cylindrosporum DSM 605]
MTEINVNDFLIFFLASIRIISMLLTAPIFSQKQIPSPFKIGFSLIVGLLVSSSITGRGFTFPANNFELALFVFKEVLIGVSIGTVATFIFNSFRMAAHLMDFGIGFSMSQYYDPTSASSATVLERFFNWIATVLFLVFNFHHILISAITRSFEVVPLGHFIISENIFSAIMSSFSKSFIIAVQIAAPIMIIMFITDFTLGLIARTVPQIQVFVLGMPIKVLLGLLALSAIIPGLMQVFIKSLDKISPEILKVLSSVPILFFLGTDDKTEEPTSKKLQDARKKGQVAKSNDLNSGIILLGVTLFFLFLGDKIYTYGLQGMVQELSNLYVKEINFVDAQTIFLKSLQKTFFVAVPIAVTAMILGVISNVMQVGFLNSGEGLKPDFKKLNPISGIKKFFSIRTIMEFVKSILKIGLVGFVGYSFVKSKIFDIMKVSDLHPNGIYPFVKDLADSQLIRIVIVLLTIGIADYIFQKRQHKKDLRMTKQEIKDEYKQMEGDPQLKSKIKQKQREMAMSRMMHEVPKATVVVTNPTHYSIALKYSKGEGAPKVLAKGVDSVAFRIRDIAKKHNIPIVENRILARKIYAEVDINKEIPSELYGAVAEVIAYVYSIKKR